MSALRKTVVLWLPLTLGACGGETGPGLEIHDTKYVGVDANGQVLEQTGVAGDCAMDRFTGLTWEVKVTMPGPHFLGNTYSWFDPAESSDGELDYRGVPDGGTCDGSACDTWAFAQAVNQQGHCGYSDWRVPSKEELASISDLRKTKSPPTINLTYFPHAQADEYWSSNDYHFQWNSAWVWSFQFGHDRVEWKSSPRLVRLVRGTGQGLERVKD